MATKKIYYVKSVHRSRPTIWEGTIEYLVNNVFGYTLACGNSWNYKIPLQPKSYKSLINALNNSAVECRNYFDYYTESTKEEFDSATGYNYETHTGCNVQPMKN